jgi:hypothetical protein
LLLERATSSSKEQEKSFVFSENETVGLTSACGALSDSALAYYAC